LAVIWRKLRSVSFCDVGSVPWRDDCQTESWKIQESDEALGGYLGHAREVLVGEEVVLLGAVVYGLVCCEVERVE
jgi:hypothetical protein